MNTPRQPVNSNFQVHGRKFAILNLALSEIAKNAAMAFPLVRTLRLKKRRTSLEPDESEIDRYAFGLPKKVLKFIGTVEGKSILEIGPGDHVSTGLTFLALGAKSYTAMDRFPGPYRNRLALEWYDLVRCKFGDSFGRPFPVHLDNNFRFDVLPVGVEQFDKFADKRFDIICSCSVGEHVMSVSAFAHANDVMLTTGGRALHVVDFTGHVWNINPDDPLVFTRIPTWLWNLMGSNRGYNNRVPFTEFTDILQKTGRNIEVVDVVCDHPIRSDVVCEATYVIN